MEMSTLFLKKIKKFLSLFLWLFALGNDRINEVVFQKEKSGMEGIALDKTAECKLVLDTAVLAGNSLLPRWCTQKVFRIKTFRIKIVKKQRHSDGIEFPLLYLCFFHVLSFGSKGCST